jgi:NAD dependent epimerase/dehydratase family enzyme
MTVLVTGGAGFIGSHIVQRLQAQARVRVLDNLRTGRRANLDGLECEFVLGSVTDADAVRDVRPVTCRRYRSARLGEIVAKHWQFTLPLGSTSCGNRPVRRARISFLSIAYDRPFSWILRS